MIKLKIKRVYRDAILKPGELFLHGEDDFVIAPGDTVLLPTGINLNVPDEYLIDVELTEDLIDSNIIYLGKSISPDKQGYEFGIIVSNLGRKQVRIDTDTPIAVYSLIKKTEFGIEDLDDTD